MTKIAFVGGGSFSTALAILLAKKGNIISIYARDKNVVEDINKNRRNDKYIKGLNIPKNVMAYDSIDEAVKDAEYIVLGVPSHVIRTMAEKLKGKINKDSIIISIAKGIDQETDERLSRVIENELDNQVVVLSGPSHAEEVACELPTTIVATSRNMDCAKQV